MSEKTFVYSDSKAPEFTGKDQEQMNIRRQYVTALRELLTQHNTEFPEDKQTQNAILAEIQKTAGEILTLELRKIQSTFIAGLEKVSK